ncbi:guanine nucleotide exchange factor synembryn-domain-containing protein [Mycena polygramma]|nr:guanine nucleotide exchange factor synembryn-domain-containing protein [Mycena polygramma]
MSSLLQQYHASSSQDVRRILNVIITDPPFALDQAVRSELIQLLLEDLSFPTKGRISSKDNTLALVALKTLGRDPSGSEALGTAPNLIILLGLGATDKDGLESACEALRCIANALLLIEDARAVFISTEVSGGETCVALLRKSANPEEIFILSRILFLLTVQPSSFLVSLVEEKHNGQTILDTIGAKLDLLIASLLFGRKMACEAMVEILKLTFNILLLYPQSPTNVPDGDKTISDQWSPTLDRILPPLLRAFLSLPPTFPAPLAAPLAHVIHSLIIIPVSPALRKEWFRSHPRLGGSSPALARLPSHCGTSTASKAGPLHRTLSVLSAGRRSVSSTPSRISSSPPFTPSRPTSPMHTLPADVLLRAHTLLDVAFSHYFPEATDPDDPSVRDLVKIEAGPGASTDANTLDDALAPLVVLITRLCLADAASRAHTRDWLVPTPLDHGGSLERRADTLGRCLRLLSSVCHLRLKDAVGEMLFAMCDSDGEALSALVGYDQVAGFLFHKGIMNALPPPAAGAYVDGTEQVMRPSGPVMMPAGSTATSSATGFSATRGNWVRRSWSLAISPPTRRRLRPKNWLSTLRGRWTSVRPSIYEAGTRRLRAWFGSPSYKLTPPSKAVRWETVLRERISRRWVTIDKTRRRGFGGKSAKRATAAGKLNRVCLWRKWWKKIWE